MINFLIKHFSELNTVELYTILRLRMEVFVVEQECFYQDCDDRDPLCWHITGYSDGKLAAYARLLPEGVSYDKYCSIGRVATSKKNRGMNYGKLLMEESIQFCKSQFNAPIKISAQAYLEKFYRDLGFKTVSEPYLEDDIPHIAMIYKND